jgi:hypothetical protein
MTFWQDKSDSEDEIVEDQEIIGTVYVATLTDLPVSIGVD